MTVYTGPNMVMQPSVRFNNSDCAKLTKAQKDKKYAFIKIKNNRKNFINHYCS